ncbi:N-6 DNA methylase [Burkholderia metallica]|uniref:N-6 DNA methylase n=1 Tax=Burkholderia metallica TaxID=488729 RepID=UPI0034A05A94
MGSIYPTLTPAEVSRILAAVIGIGSAKTSTNTTIYDPTCGSGSLLLKVGDAAPTAVTLYGQEKDSATSGLARMNMILHDNPTALIAQGNTLTDPKFKDGDELKTFDFVVANPPFSDKRWSTGLDPIDDPYGRFDTFGMPPAKQGDYAYLLHIVRSLKSTGKGACILPHGVLFRGNAEGEIRKNLVRHGYIKGIIGLPANLFYGTGIPACIIVIDKENAQARKGIFMVDASQGFIKDGPKNRLREQDIHRIVDVFNRQDESDPRYARMVGLAEIEKNDFNLNLPRYIDSSVAEDIQDIHGHLKGGIPLADVEALGDYWAVCPQLKDALFKRLREGYVTLAVDKAAIKLTIFQHPQFAAYLKDMRQHFDAWRAQAVPKLKALDNGFHPKQLIVELADGLLNHYEGKPLLDAYDVYQHLLDYWVETMQDDAYLLAADGWVAQTYRVIEKTKKGKGENAKVVEKDKGWACDLVPKQYIVARYFAAEQKAIDETSATLEAASSALAELEEEHSGEEAAFSGFDKVNAAAVKERIKEIGKDEDAAEELAVLKQWQSLSDKEAGLKKALKTLEAELDANAYAQYPKLTVDEIKTLVVEDKWLAALSATVSDELERVSQTLTSRVRDLALRYEFPLPVLVDEVAALSARVEAHLRKMGATWN